MFLVAELLAALLLVAKLLKAVLLMVDLSHLLMVEDIHLYIMALI